ncbi:GNAT family N-acetyltransferase [Dactylosporangium sucinum]|uniref:GNAT family N-acetyltransferase n=1 Tax=Dactylosporangium sucinum TaxID=1424081 RepID=UPI003570EB22
MLEDSVDFPHHLLYIHQRRGGTYHRTYVAWRDGKIDGVLTGSFDADFADSRDFCSFDLPSAPHALLDRVHVRESARGTGVGRALVKIFASEASVRGCSFIGGFIDQSSEATARRLFFERLAFVVSTLDSFGARPTDVLAASANR